MSRPRWMASCLTFVTLALVLSVLRGPGIAYAGDKKGKATVEHLVVGVSLWGKGTLATALPIDKAANKVEEAIDRQALDGWRFVTAHAFGDGMQTMLYFERPAAP